MNMSHWFSPLDEDPDNHKDHRLKCNPKLVKRASLPAIVAASWGYESNQGELRGQEHSELRGGE
jgi:hypothetical protein